MGIIFLGFLAIAITMAILSARHIKQIEVFGQVIRSETERCACIGASEVARGLSPSVTLPDIKRSFRKFDRERNKKDRKFEDMIVYDQ